MTGPENRQPLPQAVESSAPAPADGRRGRWYRRATRRAIVVATATAVAAGLGGLIFLVDSTKPADVAVPSQQAALRQWWSTAEPAVKELQAALYESQFALRRFDAAALGPACQRMHDAAAVELPARLPAPDRMLTAELNAAAEDAHHAAHMCLAVLNNSPTNYVGEFASSVEQAEKQLRAANARVERILTTRAAWDAKSGKQ
ncbi:hypothetical protein ACN27E_07465 [Mycobacterium sp. WMMD1722]|uniref:hypothetical protein n=1 Tax=Mycobacterium sp. WMMD1722 TaxID=3404117 RepID=UPI003BF54881